MTQSNDISTFEIENPISSMLSDFSKSFSSFKETKASLEDRSRVLTLLANADDELEMWGRAIGHLSWLASTHDEAGKETLEALGIAALMQGKLLTIASTLSNLKWEVTHGYDECTNKSYPIDT